MNNIADQTLRGYFAHMDEEMVKLYHTDSIFYQAVYRAAHSQMSFLQMLTLAFKAVSKERDHFKQMALDQARMSPTSICS